MSSDLSVSSDGDFGFAFNNVNFSDRLLRIEITSGSGEVSSSSSVVDLVGDRKRKREDYENNNNNYKHEKALVMADQEPQSGGEDDNEYNNNCGVTNNPSVVSVRELHISSAILAAKSPFFYKLFSNGMLESKQKQMTLKIDASEETAVMELLNFMYSNSVSVTAPHALLDVIIVADKFEVASCMKYCSQLLLKTPMTLDSALRLLDLPSSLLMAESVKPLTNAARQFIASRYKNLLKHTSLLLLNSQSIQESSSGFKGVNGIPMEELMALPLVGIEAILASDGLEVLSEDLLYEFVLRWAKSHYTVPEERQEILGSHLARYIHFPHMTCGKLKQILTSNDFTPCVASKLVLEALLFKAESLDRRRRLLADEQPASRFAERAYIYRPIKIMEFEVPRHQCIVYLDLKRKECESILPSSWIPSQTFPLGGQEFVLAAQRNMEPLGAFHCFGLFLWMRETGSASLSVDYEFSVRLRPTLEFENKFKGNYSFTKGKASGSRNLLLMPWDAFLAKNCPYFINDVLHLRADLSIRL
ncbi:PREDICTED: BTB/POZ domain-containing protein At4g01160-like isoform X2 [Camelina sativa]|uniref:BTB/POZ domain-containing protein At4g01160-like isoform X2 n=1 Tax=Camelina sativa TaxID=90675 RepID=A0ABM0VHH7_CAMSA|nr:PREDICTED: BTB/POZ domain-containing protein At4g01160-like isoform X2 [Camelina sativa]